MYDPIYSQNIGLCGFRCRIGACKKVVRTYRGIVMHCKRVHNLTAQMTLPGMEKIDEKAKATEQSEPIRDKRTAEREQRRTDRNIIDNIDKFFAES